MWYWTKILFTVLVGAVLVWLIYEVITFPDISKLRTENPTTSSMIEYRISEAKSDGKEPKKFMVWMPIEQISPHLQRAVLAGEDSRFFEHDGFDWDAINKAWDEAVKEGEKEAKAEGDYDLLVIGTPTMSGSGNGMFGPVIDDLIKLSKTPTLVVKGENVPQDWAPRRILVPANASNSSKNAADLAFAIAGSDAVVTGVHVVTPSRLSGKQPNIALDVTADFEIVATRMGQHAETEVREAEDVETGILEAVEDFGADLLILGSSVRAGTTHLHLGPRVEYLTRLAPCPVVILNS